MRKIIAYFIGIFLLPFAVQAQKIEILSPQNELKQAYDVEIADTPQKIEKGLMERQKLPQNQGMWFDMTIVPAETPIAFWMKNTLIALDILFIDENGQIFFIKENAEPQDTSLIWPPRRPTYVLEINGGQSQKHHLQAGDFIHKKLIK